MVLACALALPTTGRPQESVAGIRFFLGADRDSGPAGGVFQTFEGVVLFAAGRGRLDILERGQGPTVVVDGLTVTAPLAGRGDYYLFDSTGFVLVRPATKTFSSFSLTDAAYDYQYSRDGWPAIFTVSPIVPETVSVTRPATERLAQRGPISIYWHLDLNQQMASMRIIAGGRLGVQAAPAGEVSVVRWFGPSHALANMTAAVGARPSGIVGLTAVAVLSPPGESRVPINFITLQRLWGLKTVDVDLVRLVLPVDFTETTWPGFERSPNPPGLSSDKGAKWRAPPLTDRKPGG